MLIITVASIIFRGSSCHCNVHIHNIVVTLRIKLSIKGEINPKIWKEKVISTQSSL